MRKKIFTSLFIIACIVTTGFLVFTANAESFSLNDGIYKKILLNEMEQCFNSDNMYSEVHVGASSSDSLEYKTFSNNILKKGEKETDGLNILLPTGMGSGNNLDDDVTLSGIGCYELFLGDDTALGTFDGNMVGLLQLTGHNAPIWTVDNEAKIKEFLKNFGYTKQEDLNEGTSDGKSCIKIQSKKIFADEIDNVESLYAGKETQDVVDICWSKEHLELDNYIDFGKADIKTYEDSDLIYYGYDTEFSTIYFTKDYSGKEWCIESLEYAQGDVCKYDGMMGGKYAALSFEISDDNKPVLAGGTIYQNYLTVYYGDSSEEYKAEAYSYDFTISNYDDNSVSTNSSATKAQKFTMGNDAYSVARKFLSGTSGAKEAISPKEQYEYYMSYIDGTYGMNPISETCTSKKPTLNEAVAGNIIKRNNGWCQHTYNSSNDKNVTVFAGYSKGNDIYSLTMSTDAKGVVERLYLLADSIDEEEIKKIEEGIKKKEYDDKVDAAANMDPCFSKANSLGWILCPVIEFLSDTTENLYSWIEDDFMVIETNFFARTESSSAYSVWSSFVGFANTLLVIFLMIIVFSQLTGIGIDNYGIKKTLPKIIIAAILINLSYIVCELAVDLSNILGRGLNDWFTAVGQDLPLININTEEGAVGTNAGLFNTLKIAISGGVISSSVITIVETVSGGGFVAILLPLLIALVVAVVAIFFFFVLLGLRKAGVIMLVAISPLAFICYTLPNTKPLFKKWLKALEGLLILYPICGLMIGGGYYVSRVILSISGDYFMRFVAFMLTVVPFFFIPKLLVGSFAAMGNIGAKISGISKSFGKRTSTRLDKGIRNSERFKDTQERHAGERANRIAARLKKRSETGDLSARDQRRLVRYNKQANEWNAANDSGHLSAILAAQEQAVGEQRVKDEEALIRSGAGGINANSPESLESGYKAAIDALDANPTDASMLAKVKAFQNVMSKTDKGRASMQKVLEQAVKDGKDSAAYSAASHLSSEHMGDIKNVNRGMFGMLNDIASGEGGDKLNLSGVRSNIDSKKYDIAGANKYTAKTLSSADEETLNRLANGISYMSNNERNSISQTANTALSNPNIVADLKPEVVENLRKLANSGVGGTSGRMGPHGSADMDESGF